MNNLGTLGKARLQPREDCRRFQNGIQGVQEVSYDPLYLTHLRDLVELN